MKSTIIERYSIEEAFRDLSKKPQSKVVESITENKNASTPVIPAPYDKYFVVSDYVPDPEASGEYQIGEQIEGYDAHLIAYLDTKPEYADIYEGWPVLVDDESFPVVEIVGGRMYPVDIEEIFADVDESLHESATSDYTYLMYITYSTEDGQGDDQDQVNIIESNGKYNIEGESIIYSSLGDLIMSQISSTYDRSVEADKENPADGEYNFADDWDIDFNISKKAYAKLSVSDLTKINTMLSKFSDIETVRKACLISDDVIDEDESMLNSVDESLNESADADEDVEIPQVKIRDIDVDRSNYKFALWVSGEVAAYYRDYDAAEEALDNLRDEGFDLAIIDADSNETLYVSWY